MKVLVDTSVWSLVLRRGDRRVAASALELQNLIADGRAQMIGPIRQEILSGLRDEAQFTQLATHLAAFPDVPIMAEDYVTAARFFNLCRQKGIQGSNTDFLICAVAVHHRFAIFTTDKDFSRYAIYLPISLHTSTR